MHSPSTPDITWDIAVPLLNNRAVTSTLARVWCIAVLLLGALLSVALGVQGEWEALPGIWLMLVAVAGGLMLLSLVVMGLVFRNRMRFRFTISDDGILFETIDPVARATSRLAVIAGVLGGSGQAVGAGLIAQSQEAQALKWSGGFRVRFVPQARLIVLRNAWRDLMLVYCTPENYEQVAERVRGSMQRHGTEGRVPKHSPLPRYLGYSALIVVASLPLFALAETFDLSLLTPILVLCFALATVWLVGLFGYVVLAGIAFLLGTVAVDTLSIQASLFEPGATFPLWTVYSGDDWAVIALATAGAAALAWVSIQAVRGRIPSMLASDASDMGL